MMATTASLGMVLLWDVDGGLQQIDKFLYSSDDYIKAGLLFLLIIEIYLFLNINYYIVFYLILCVDL